MSKKINNLISKEELLEIVCKYFKVNESKVISKSRQTYLVIIRMVFSYIAFSQFRINKSDIGRVLGGRDHTTAINAIEQCKINIENKSFNIEQHINNILNIVRSKYECANFEVLPLSEYSEMKKQIEDYKEKINELKKINAKLRTDLALERIMNKKQKGKTKLIDYGIDEKKEPIVRHIPVYSNQKSLYPEL